MYIPTSKYRNLTYLFLEKDGTYFNVFRSNAARFEQEKEKEQLIDVLSDDPGLVAYLENDGYAHGLNEIINAVRGYNLGKHQEPDSYEGMELQTVVFYRPHKGEEHGMLTLNIGGENYEFDRDDIHRIDLPVNQPIAVCYTADDQPICDLIMANPYFRKVYAVSFSKNYGFTVSPGNPEYIAKYIPLR
jgi:hypothetical protein